MKNIAFAILTTTLTQHAFSADTAPIEHAPHSTIYSGHASNTMHGMEGMDSDPWLNYLRVDQFEWRDSDSGSIMAWDATAWSGKSIDRLWFNAKGERLRGHTEHAETQLLYSHAATGTYRPACAAISIHSRTSIGQRLACADWRRIFLMSMRSFL
jgi:uncharacterized protein involved in copper resistance